MNHIHQGDASQRDIPSRAKTHAKESGKQHRNGGERSTTVEGNELEKRHAGRHGSPYILCKEVDSSPKSVVF